MRGCFNHSAGAVEANCRAAARSLRIPPDRRLFCCVLALCTPVAVKDLRSAARLMRSLPYCFSVSGRGSGSMRIATLAFHFTTQNGEAGS